MLVAHRRRPSARTSHRPLPISHPPTKRLAMCAPDVSPSRSPRLSSPRLVGADEPAGSKNRAARGGGRSSRWSDVASSSGDAPLPPPPPPSAAMPAAAQRSHLPAGAAGGMRGMTDAANVQKGGVQMQQTGTAQHSGISQPSQPECGSGGGEAQPQPQERRQRRPWPSTLQQRLASSHVSSPIEAQPSGGGTGILSPLSPQVAAAAAAPSQPPLPPWLRDRGVSAETTSAAPAPPTPPSQQPPPPPPPLPVSPGASLVAAPSRLGRPAASAASASGVSLAGEATTNEAYSPTQTAVTAAAAPGSDSSTGRKRDFASDAGAGSSHFRGTQHRQLATY